MPHFLPGDRLRIAAQALVIAAAWAALPAQAGRPLATDDAGTAESGTCQVEAWGEKAGPDRALVVAPACGVLPGLELGAELVRPQPRDVVRSGAGLALKWAPESWSMDTGAGKLNLGIKLGAAWVQPAGAGWQRADSGALALASLKLDEAWTLHGNVGVAREHIGGARASVGNLALVWTPAGPWLFFAEAQANSRREVFGGTVSTVGARYWLMPDKLGLDLTASRESGAGGPTRWTFGLGWYGIGS